MRSRPTHWEEEVLFPTGDEYFRSLLVSIDQATASIEMESYIFEKGILADRICASLVAASKRGVRTRLIVDGWGSPNFVSDYWPRLREAGIKVRMFRVIPWLLRRMPGDPEGFFKRLLWRWRSMNRGNHRKFCLVDQRDLWVGSFNISDVHLREIYGDQAWKDIGVRVRGFDVEYAKRAFKRAYRGWAAINFPSRSPRLLLLNDSYIHKRRTRLQHIQRIRNAEQRIWIATPYFVPIGKIYRRLIKQALRGVDVRLMVPRKNDVWIMKWISVPLIRHLVSKGVNVYVYEPRFMHQKVLVADDWMCIGSTNLNHRSFLHDLEMDVVITHEHNKTQLLSSFVRDQEFSEPFDSSEWAHRPWWQRCLSSTFLVLKYWS